MGSAGMFFSERPECWKGHGLHKNRSKRSPCYSVHSLPSMLSLTLIHSLSLSFSLSLCSPPLIISVVRLLIFHSSSLHLYFCSSRSSLWMHSTDLKLISCAVDLKKKEISSEITTMLHVNLPRPHHWCRANWGCHEKNYICNWRALCTRTRTWSTLCDYYYYDFFCSCYVMC